MAIYTLKNEQMKRAEELFDDLRDAIDNEELLNDIDRVEKMYMHVQEKGDSSRYYYNFPKAWTDFKKRYAGIFRQYVFNNVIRDMRLELATIHGIYAKLSVETVRPKSSEIDYKEYVTDFKDALDRLKQMISAKQFDDGFVKTVTQFHTDVQDAFAPAFTYAKMEQRALSKIIADLKASVERFVGLVRRTIDANPFPEALFELDSAFASPKQDKRLPKPPSAPELVSVSDVDVPNTTIQSSLSDILTDIKSCSLRLKEIARNSNERNTASRLESECRFLARIAESSLDQDWKMEKQALEDELQRCRETINFVNTAQAARRDIDIEKLRKLSSEELISLTLSVLGDKDVKVPIELSFNNGTPSDFKHLAKKYHESRISIEQAEVKIEKLNAALIQLQSENEVLKTRVNASNREHELRSELEKIDERTSQIESELRKKVVTGRHSSRPYETVELKDEIKDLIQKRAQIKHQLGDAGGNEYEKEVLILKKANTQLQSIIDDQASRITRMRTELTTPKQIDSDDDDDYSDHRRKTQKFRTPVLEGAKTEHRKKPGRYESYRQRVSYT